AARHEAGQVRLARDHFRGRGPVRPFRLARDIENALPLKACAPDADAVADRAAVALNEIKMTFRGLDDDGAGRLGRAVEHHLLAVFRVELERIIGNETRLIAV